MVLIQEREIIKRIPIYLKIGKNQGKKAGIVYIEKNKTPYMYIIKNFRSGQMFRKPEHIGKLPLSEHLIPELDEYNVKNIIYMIVGLENKSFFVIVPLKDLKNAKRMGYDEPQKYIWLKDYSRIYPEQKTLM